MGGEGQGSGGAGRLQEKIDGRAVQRLALLADKQRLDGRLWFHPVALFQPCLDSLHLVGAERVGGREAALEPLHMQDAALDVHMIEGQGADFRNAESVPVREKQQAAVALLVPAGAGRAVDQHEHLTVREVLTACFFPAARPVFPCFCGLSHFVESLPFRKVLKPLQTGQGLFQLSTKWLILSRVNLCGLSFDGRAASLDRCLELS